MNPSTEPGMPMGSAARLPLNAAQLMPSIRGIPAAGAPPAPAAGLMAPGGSPIGFPAPGAPEKPPFEVEMQPNGTSVYYVPGSNGQKIILGVNPPPKMPKALQPNAPAA